MIQEVTNRKDLETSIKVSEGHLIVVYSTQSCGYCKLLKVELDAIDKAQEAQIIVFDITNAQQEVADKRITGVPYIEFYHEGKFLNKMVGYKRRDELTAHIIF